MGSHSVELPVNRRRLALAAAALAVVGILWVIGRWSGWREDPLREDLPAPAPAIATTADLRAPNDAGTGKTREDRPVDADGDLPAVDEREVADLATPLGTFDPWGSVFGTDDSVRDPLGLFDRAMPRALAGDGAAMVEVAHAIMTCSGGGELAQRTPIEIEAFFERARVEAGMEAGIEALYRDGLRELRPRCEALVQRRPAEFESLDEWSSDWTRRAAAAGDKVARLRIALREWFAPVPGRPQDRVQDEDTTRTITSLLEEAYRQRDRRVFQYVPQWYANRHADEAEHLDVNPDPWELVISPWQVLACRHNSICNPAVMRASLDAQLRPAEVDEIYAVADHIDAQWPPIDFRDAPAFGQWLRDWAEP